jgi:hypothetical protein
VNQFHGMAIYGGVFTKREVSLKAMEYEAVASYVGSSNCGSGWALEFDGIFPLLYKPYLVVLYLLVLYVLIEA